MERVIWSKQMGIQACVTGRGQGMDNHVHATDTGNILCGAAMEMNRWLVLD